MRSRTTPPTLFPISFEEAARRLIEDAYAEHASYVYRTLLYLGVEPAFVEDALQDVFVAAYRRVQDFDRDRSMRAWLYGIARKVASQYRRGAKRRKRRLVVVHDAARVQPPAASHADRVADGLTARKLLARLDPDKRRAFLLAELEGLSAPEIARAEGANVNTVYARIRAARLRFARMVASLRAGADEEDGVG